jgi:hypothetical protein
LEVDFVDLRERERERERERVRESFIWNYGPYDI